MQNVRIKKNNGFSLLETIVAISILMITIVGPLSLASKGIVFADYVKDEITGFYLAQESVEAIKNIIDTNKKNNIDWLDGIKGVCMTGNGDNGVPCRIDIWKFNEPNYGIVGCGAEPEEICNKLKVVDVGSGSTIRLYGRDFSANILNNPQHPPVDSIFSRKITIRNVTNDYLAMDPVKIPVSERGLLTLDPSGIDEINVSVEVSWTRTGNPRSITVSENLFSI